VADTHEVYPSAPLALVAVEIRFPGPSGRWPLPATLQRAFRDRLGEDWVVESLRTQKIEVEFGAAGAGRQSVEQVVLPRFTTRDRTLAVAVSEQSLTIETTSYRHYLDFRVVLEAALVAAAEILRPDGVARLGMRYIDEIRVPNAEGADLPDWGLWLDPSLLPPRLDAMASKGYASAAWEGAAQFVVGTNQTLVLRHGARTGYAVNPSGLLRRPSVPEPGPVFVLDFDCFWEPVDIPPFEVGSLIEECDHLRAPVRALFDLLISDKLREDVFMKEPADV
jgi:uncharacterized protein (TIGR04255 family)